MATSGLFGFDPTRVCSTDAPTLQSLKGLPRQPLMSDAPIVREGGGVQAKSNSSNVSGGAADLGGEMEVGYISRSEGLLGGSGTTRKQVWDQLSASIIESIKASNVFRLGYTAEQIRIDPSLRAELERAIVDGIVASFDPSGPVGPGVRKDFVQHATISAVIAASLRTTLGPDWAFFATAGLGLFKELFYDGMLGRGNPDYIGDLPPDILGALAGAYGEINGVSQKSGFFISPAPSKLAPSDKTITAGHRWSF